MRPEPALPGILLWTLGALGPILLLVPVILIVLLLMRGCPAVS